MFRQRLIFSILILLIGTYVNCHAQAKMIGVISDSLSQDDLPGAENGASRSTHRAHVVAQFAQARYRLEEAFRTVVKELQIESKN